MKTRIITAAIGISIFIFIMVFYNTLVLNFSVSLICSSMVYEIFCATNMKKKAPFMYYISLGYSFLFSFLQIYNFLNYRIFAIILYVGFVILYLLKKSSQLKVYCVFFCCVFSVFATLFTNNILLIRAKLSPFGIYYTVLFSAIPWICDAGGYFIGLKFGKRKLAPTISPKKTVEGAIGGVLITFVVVLLCNFVFYIFYAKNIKIDFLMLAVLTFLGSIISIIGDLSMSVFKRQNNIKDFGNMLKGHGGVLDRFDSWIFVIAVLYPLVRYFPIVIT